MLTKFSGVRQPLCSASPHPAPAVRRGSNTHWADAEYAWQWIETRN